MTTSGSSRGWTRRGALAAGTAVAVSLLSRRAGLAAPALVKGSKLTVWGGLIFSKEANQIFTDAVNAWGKANGIVTEVVMVNQNETVQKVSAAVASGTLPDVIDIQIDYLLPLARQGLMLPVDDLFAEIGQAGGGWYPSAQSATETKAVAGARVAIPFGLSGNLLLRRKDLLEKAGFKAAPATWQELVAQAAAVTQSSMFGLGFALSNVGDGNVQISVLQSFGGRIAADDGRTVTIKSDKTRLYLGWLKDAWDKKLFPPGVATWDGAGDNQAYLSGQAAFIANTGSVGIAARTQDPELYAATAYSALPGGPIGVISPVIPQVRAIPKTSKNPDAAKALIAHLATDAVMKSYFQQAIYGPVLKNQGAYPAFDGKDPVLAGLLNLVESGSAPGYPDVYNAAFADLYSNFVIPKMAQRVVIDGWSFDRAMDEAQTQGQIIYDKYK
jgi:multiple sugar transport system substrate-binding protein